MRRTNLVPTTLAAALRARHVLVAISLATLLALAITLATPVTAQEETTAQTTNGAETVTKGKDASDKQEQSVQGGGQEAEVGDDQTMDPLKGRTVDNIEKDSIGLIPVAGCEAVAGEIASITIADAEDADEKKAFTDDEDTAFQFGQQGITITAEGDETDLAKDFDVVTGKVIDSEGIVCDHGEQRADENDDENSVKNTDDQRELSCDELLVLFRAEGGQYGNASDFADSDLQARIEVCLKREIVDGPGGKLPETGGLSLLALAVLGAVMAAAGLSVIRGGRR